ncbi:MAG: hypothetical protein WCE96_01490 [Nitrososphaeraceae archaeon]
MNKGLDILAWYPACTVSRLMGVSWSDKTLIRALSFLGPQSTTSRLPLGSKAKVVVSSLERHIVTMLIPRIRATEASLLQPRTVQEFFFVSLVYHYESS